MGIDQAQLHVGAPIASAEPTCWVRPAVQTDIPNIVEMVADAKPNCRPLTRAEVESELTNFSVVSTASREVAATGVLRFLPSREAQVGSIAVASSETGKGLGALLIRFLLAGARSRQVRTVRCTTRIPEFFQRFGFEVVRQAPTAEWDEGHDRGAAPRVQMALALEPAELATLLS